ncbi:MULTISPECIES: 4Fe-4S dicluster domain-containing protein [unclassified Mesorhizobium]|uniref:4Fe-4S dicluster domain-containing protein n=1 Tax=unclassified Mesorhizobium TaxID=325217 RepID=UPI001125C797|nr:MULTISPECIES: 4Fe-4S dicluster domain-containing protein [unclassified Mesorhizobium]MCA0058143.1 4Fe-4S dicluster domain-containing protein [Mesorhizobium sp. B261B1A]TPL12150.1 4Fe-4S dicluster domain-containing protein [Mesorhizobium sp. B2-4-11]
MILSRGRMEEIAAALGANGLILRGGFTFEDGEAAPCGRSGAPARSALLVGQAGAAPWPHFLRWRDSQSQAIANPLDTWSRQVIGAVAGEFGARAVSPSDKPYLPFQQWAMRAEGLKPSPLGILMHPRYGLWHAYRGALLFEHEIALPEASEAIHLCDACVGKPCLKSCPVGAYSAEGFAYQSCLAHVRGANGQPCRDGGCLDRNACPYGVAYRYPPDVQAFHMAAFAGL